MRLLKTWACGVAVALLSACGGGGGGGGNSLFGNTGNTTPPSGPAAATVEVIASATSVGTGGDKVTITAVVKDAGNVGMANAAVAFSTDSGTLTSATTTTDATGTATALLSTGADKSNRSATVTVTSGSVHGSISLPISGSKLQVSGSTTLSLGAAGSLTVKAIDSAGNPIAGSLISVSSALHNGLDKTSGTTDSQGQLQVTYTASTAGTDTLTFTGIGSTVTSTMGISGEDFSFISPVASTQVVVTQSQVLQVRYRQNGVPQAGRTVNFAATAGSLTASSATTDATGVASVSISSSSAVSSIVQATLVGGTAQATLPLQFVAVTPATLVLQVSPSAIGPNLGASTANQSQVTARVRDALGNPVSGATVNFSRVADPSGGNLLQASAVTDASGQATVQYVSGPDSTSSGGVVLQGSVAGSTGVASTASLTVNQSALFIALGTGNVISNLDPQTYQKDWTVYVTDANGVAVSGVTLTVRALPQAYAKGSLTYDGTSWVYSSNVVTCANEDANYNGLLNTGEDFNADGRLEPGNVISVTPGTVQTNSAGRATVSLIYAESYAPWVQIALQVQALVNGTESTTQSVFWVNGLSSDFTDETVPPAGRISPFGTAACNING